MENFETIDVINKGVFKTTLIRDTFSGQRYVKKELPKATLPIYQKLQNLKHHSLAEVIKIIEEDDKIIVILEYVTGETLKSILDTKVNLDEKLAINYTQQLTSILNILHQNGIIHRDVNPSNIIISTNGRVKLIDFDIARFYKSSQIEDTQLLGTPGYAAPEQFGFNQSTASSDIYALGILLNVMITGMKPNEMLIKNEDLAIIVKNCIAMEQTLRYQDVRQLDYDLRRLEDTPSNIPIQVKKRKKQISPAIAVLFSLLFWIFLIGSILLIDEHLLQEPSDQVEPDEASVNFEENLFLEETFTMEIAPGWRRETFEGYEFLMAPNGISNINILSEHMRRLSLDAYIDLNLQTLENYFPDFELMSRENVDVNGKYAVLLNYTSDGGIHIFYQFFVDANGIAYIITYTETGFGDFLDDVFEMVETFTLR